MDFFKTTISGGDSKSDSLNLEERINHTKTLINKFKNIIYKIIFTAFLMYLLPTFASSVSLTSQGNKMGDTTPSFLLWTSSMQSPTFSIGLDVFTGP